MTRYGTWSSKMSLMAIVKDRLKTYYRWQRRWYSESGSYMGDAEFNRFRDMGYTPFCPGPVCSFFMKNGLHVERAPAAVCNDGLRRNNLWYVYNDAGEESILQYHSMDDLDETSRANAIAIRYANDMFVDRQNSGLMDTPIEVQELERFSNPAYHEIFGVNPVLYFYPDSVISDNYRDTIQQVQGWGRSVGHARTKNQAPRDERDAIGALTGERVPSTPAAAAGGKANKGGYYPHQPAGKGKSVGRSAPYPQAASSSSSGSAWQWSTGWGDWSGWQGWSWSSRGWWH